jgi:hypothetical protein
MVAPKCGGRPSCTRFLPIAPKVVSMAGLSSMKSPLRTTPSRGSQFCCNRAGYTKTHWSPGGSGGKRARLTPGHCRSTQNSPAFPWSSLSAGELLFRTVCTGADVARSPPRAVFRRSMSGLRATARREFCASSSAKACGGRVVFTQGVILYSNDGNWSRRGHFPKWPVRYGELTRRSPQCRQPSKRGLAVRASQIPYQNDAADDPSGGADDDTQNTAAQLRN